LINDLSLSQDTKEETIVKSVTGTADKFFSAVRTRSAVETEPRYTKFPKLECVPPQLEMDYSVILNKPFFIKNIAWSNTSVIGSTISTLNIPTDILTNPLVRIPFEASVYYRAKISVVFQVAGTPMHSGLLIASALPNGADKMWQPATNLINMNKYLAAPHVFLSANEATPVVLEVPFYVNSKLQPISINGTSVTPAGGDYAEVLLTVVNAMGVPTSGTNTLTISAHFMFTELEFYAPHVDPAWVVQSNFSVESFVEGAKGFVTNVFDRVTSGVKSTVKDAYDLIGSTKVQMFDLIDSGRAYLRTLTGLHNPADSTITSKCAVQLRQNTNVVDAPIQIEKLDPYSQFSHYTRDYTFDTDIDEMLISEIVSKPQYVGTFGVRSADVEGTILFSRPITPFQEINQVTYTEGTPPVTVTTIATTSLLQNIHFLSRYWRGGLKLHIQSAMSNFHYCKLTIARNYSPDVNMQTSVPAFNSVPNLMMETLEFTGHQVHTIELPFVSLLEQLPCSTDMRMNALQHGMYYIYVHQPLVVNGSIPTAVKFNVYVSGAPDLQFFGYATRPMYVSSNISDTPILRTHFYDKEGNLIEPPDKIEGDKTLALEQMKSLPVMQFGEDGFSAEAMVEDQQNVLLHEHEQVSVKPTDLRPIVSIRDYGRRWTRAFYTRFTPTQLTNFDGAVQVDVAQMLGVRGSVVPQGIGVGTILQGMNSAKLVNSMFLGYSGGARFKVSVLGATISECYYVPPGFHAYNVDVVSGREWRSTAPFAHLNVAPAGSSYYNSTSAQYIYAEKTDNPAAHPYLLSPCPMQDKPNYLASSDMLDVGLAGAEFQRMPMVVSTHEVEVPHMSPFRFVGNTSKGYQPALSNYSYYNANNDMGYLVLKLAQPVTYYPSVAPISSSIAIEIFSSFDDVGRAGYQVFAPTTVLPAVKVVSGLNSNYYQVGPDSLSDDLNLGYLPGLLSAPSATAASIIPVYDYTKAFYKTVP
jgi:hypothetical protein